MRTDLLADFKPITLSDQKTFTSFFKKYPPQISEYTFTNLFIWRDYYQFRWKMTENCLLLISLQDSDIIKAFPPLGKDWEEELQYLMTFANNLGRKLEFHRVAETYLAKLKDLGNSVSIHEDRDNWDYVYPRGAIASFGGEKYENVRKKLNKFKRRNQWEYRPITPEIVDILIRLQNLWCRYRSCSDDVTLEHENEGIIEILNNWDRLEVQGGAIFTDEIPVAYSIGEPLNQENFVIHIEKGSEDYQGAYQAIAQEFADHIDPKYKYINREQDLGDKGLRKSKKSYHPDHFIKKYIVTFT